jgi:hypothetical protein
MGQIFHACIYDIDSMTCCAMDADKFHANCYSFSSTVASTHYLLRQKPYRVMWGGDYAIVEDFSRMEDLLGLSIYIDYEDIKLDYDDLEEKAWPEKAKVVSENNSRWKRITVWEEAQEYFDWENRRSVKYNGYLLNHTQKLAVDLGDYFIRSMYMKKEKLAAIDAIPVLTETGDGTSMTLSAGIATDSTEELQGTWRGDLLQIVDQLPEDYKVIDCCFAEIWDRAKFCYHLFGVDASNYVLADWHGKRYECADLFKVRGPARYIKVELTEDKIRYLPELVSKATSAPAAEDTDCQHDD